ncbi:MAG TPA: hypothetical protein VE081_09590, partial [Sporichthyaceae bacterium]|nr:hypothetical protein [Sporichthyaceae bacterium]
MSHRQIGARRRPRRVLPAVLVATALVAATVGVEVLTHQDAQGGTADWQTVWSDDFTGAAGTAPSTANWLTDTGHGYPNGTAGWGNNELENYTADPANLGLDGAGNLRITATRDAAGTWTSGRLETARTDFAPAAGGTLKVEARL